MPVVRLLIGLLLIPSCCLRHLCPAIPFWAPRTQLWAVPSWLNRGLSFLGPRSALERWQAGPILGVSLASACPSPRLEALSTPVDTCPPASFLNKTGLGQHICDCAFSGVHDLKAEIISLNFRGSYLYHLFNLLVEERCLKKFENVLTSF